MADAGRIAWLDFAKGVAMILVVLGHVLLPDFPVNKFFATFRMPFFFVTAGFLLNLSKWSGAENFKPFVEKLFRRLLVPYYLAELAWYPIWFVVCRGKGYLNYLQIWSDVDPLKGFLAIFVGKANGIDLILGPLWFLPALFFAEIIFVRLFNRLNKIGAEIFTLAVVSCVSVGFLFDDAHALPMNLDIALVAQIFLLAGVLIRRHNVVERLSPKIFFTLLITLVVMFFVNERVDMNFRRYGEPLLFYVGGLAGTLLTMKLSALMTDGKIFRLISACGRQSMMILILHPIVANVFYEIVVRGFDFPSEKILTEPTIICAATMVGIFIPLWVAVRFGKLPVLRKFCP